MSIPRNFISDRLALLAAVAALATVLLSGCGEQVSTGNMNADATASPETEAVAYRRDIVLSVQHAFYGDDGALEADTELQAFQARLPFEPQPIDTADLQLVVEHAGFSTELDTGRNG
jgi:hypothetical protein